MCCFLSVHLCAQGHVSCIQLWCKAGSVIVVSPAVGCVLAGELFSALKGRLSDPNKNLIMLAITTTGNVASAMGAPADKSSKVQCCTFTQASVLLRAARNTQTQAELCPFTG